MFLHHVVGDLTVGKPDIREFWEGETVEAAMGEIGEGAERAVTVWRKKGEEVVRERERAARFVGILNSLDVVAFLAKEGDLEKVMRTPVREVVRHNPSLLKEVDPRTRLIDALEMMKHGVQRLLVRKSFTWRAVSKRFSVLYYGKWLKNSDSNSMISPTSHCESSDFLSTSKEDEYCCLSREDVIRFIIGCLGAIAPIPLSSISSLAALSDNYCFIEASAPALEFLHNYPQNPCAAAVVEIAPDGTRKIIGEISAFKLWKCDYVAAAWAMSNLSAGQFVMGSEDEEQDFLPDFLLASQVENGIVESPRPKKFSSRSIGFFSQQLVGGLRSTRSMYRGRSAPLTCQKTSSLAAVMAQMLSNRATHVWVTEDEPEENILVGIVSYNDILRAVTMNPAAVSPVMP